MPARLRQLVLAHSYLYQFCSNSIVVALVGEWPYAEMMSENRIENLRNLSWRSGSHRILRAIRNKRSRFGACRLNDTRNIQRLLANVELVTKHPNLCKLVTVRSVSFALRAERNPLLPLRKCTQPVNGVLHRGGGGIKVACRMLHEWACWLCSE